MKILIATITISLLLIATAPARATTPTPAPTASCDGCNATPSGSYSRADLLAKIAPKPFTANPNLLDIDLLPKVSDTTLDGASWGLTFLAIFQAGGVQWYLAGIVVILLIVFWLRKTLVEQMKKRPMSASEAQFRTAYKSFRQDVQQYRSFRRGGGRGGRRY